MNILVLFPSLFFHRGFIFSSHFWGGTCPWTPASPLMTAVTGEVLRRRWISKDKVSLLPSCYSLLHVVTLVSKKLVGAVTAAAAAAAAGMRSVSGVNTDMGLPANREVCVWGQKAETWAWWWEEGIRWTNTGWRAAWGNPSWPWGHNLEVNVPIFKELKGQKRLENTSEEFDGFFYECITKICLTTFLKKKIRIVHT